MNKSTSNQELDSNLIKNQLKTATDAHVIEKIAGRVSASDLESLSDYLLTEERDKLPAILVGLSKQLFPLFLLYSSEANLQTLKEIVSSEPVQYRLTVLSHDIESEIATAINEHQKLKSEINALDIDSSTTADILEMELKIDQLANFLQRQITILSRALAVTWSSSRADLVESLSSTKERAEIFLLKGIGLKGQEGQDGTGIYDYLKKHLLKNFTENNAHEKLKDNDSSRDALSRFSIWYLKDYWEIGLLPGVKSLEEIESISESNKEPLFKEIDHNLEKLGLKTVSDVKQALIFSKITLKEFILKNLHKARDDQ